MKKTKNQEETGVLYIRYNKKTEVGIVIEKLKKKSPKELTKKVSEIIWLHGGLEILSYEDIGLQKLISFYWHCLNLYGGKLEEIKHKLFVQDNLDNIPKRISEKNPQVEVESFSSKTDDREEITEHSTELIDSLIPEI